MYLLRSTCRACESKRLEVIFSLGEMPLPDALLLPSQLEDAEERFPLDIAFCNDCALVQSLQTIFPSDIYDERFRFLSKSSETYVRHAAALADQLVEDRWLDGNSQVIELGSNDGTLLSHFQARGVPTLGIEPAPVPAGEARRAGIVTLPTFFSRGLAGKLAEEGRHADIVIAANLLPYVPDIHGVLAGIRMLLRDGGVAVIEVPYIRDVVESGGFDALCHEQFAYFSVTSLEPLLLSEGLHINRVEHLRLHGGTLQVFASREPHSHPSVQRFLDDERHAGMQYSGFYDGMARSAEMTKFRLLGLLDEIKAGGRHIVGYGAAARTGTVLNYCGVGENYLDYVVDLNPQKQGRFIPGVHLPVLSPARLISNRPDFVLLLARGCRDEILRQQEPYRRMGGRFIVPIPEPSVI